MGARCGGHLVVFFFCFFLFFFCLFFFLFFFCLFSKKCLSACGSVCKLSSVKDFSGTTLPRILKFGIYIEYDMLYCVRENQHLRAYHFLFCTLFCLSTKSFRHRFLSSYES